MKTTAFDILGHQGRSLKWLARRTGFSTEYLWLLKHGKRPISQEVKRRFLDAFDLPEDVLFFDDDVHRDGDIRSGEEGRVADAPISRPSGQPGPSLAEKVS